MRAIDVAVAVAELLDYADPKIISHAGSGALPFLLGKLYDAVLECDDQDDSRHVRIVSSLRAVVTRGGSSGMLLLSHVLSRRFMAAPGEPMKAMSLLNSLQSDRGRAATTTAAASPNDALSVVLVSTMGCATLFHFFAAAKEEDRANCALALRHVLETVAASSNRFPLDMMRHLALFAVRQLTNGGLIDVAEVLHRLHNDGQLHDAIKSHRVLTDISGSLQKSSPLGPSSFPYDLSISTALLPLPFGLMSMDTVFWTQNMQCFGQQISCVLVFPSISDSS